MSSPLHRAGTVAIVGRPNVGKSTLLNAAVGQALAIVSAKPQTTRDRILGVVERDGAQIALLDTPGLHKPSTRLGRTMNATAREAARTADVIVFVTDVPARDAVTLGVHPGDRTLLADIGAGTPTLLVINKVDRVKKKERLLPLLTELATLRDFAGVVPISARRTEGVERVLAEVARLLPEGPPMFEPDALTDRPIRFFASEYVREQILKTTHEEVPHAVAVQVETYDDTGAVVRIEATIHVERDGQKGILVGAGGSMLKAIGTAARERIEALVGRKVHLALWVRVTPGWTESPAALAELGYGGTT